MHSLVLVCQCTSRKPPGRTYYLGSISPLNIWRQEASHSTFELRNDDAQTIEGMLRHFYDLDPLSLCGRRKHSGTTQTERFTMLSYLVQLYAIAVKYDAPVLKERILSNFTALTFRNWLLL
jgi:hypothetical protein